MPTFVKGDMWSVFGKTDLFLITTNPIVRKDGAAVMGRGIAEQAATRYPEIQRSFGQWLQITPSDRNKCGWICTVDAQQIGYFMVKNHWRGRARLSIIKESVASLLEWTREYDHGRIDLNFPGIGNGKLSREEVLPLLAPLPDHVHIWEYE